MSLPELVVFQINDAQQELRNLSFTGPQRQLRFGIEETIFSDNASFSVEPAGSGLVHIRSRFEDKYWVRASRFEPWLSASSAEKVEDVSRDECTLFRPQFSPGNVTVRLVHAQTGFNVIMRPATDVHAYNLCAEHGAPTEFSFIDFSELSKLKLPRYVSFKGDNQRWLTANLAAPEFISLRFNAGVASNDRMGFEIMYTRSGKVRITSLGYGGFLAAKPNSNVVELLRNNDVDHHNDPSTLFEVVQSRSRGIISLYNRGVDLYCYRMQHQDTLGLGKVKPTDPEAFLQPWHAGRNRNVYLESFGQVKLVSESNIPWKVRHVSNTSNVEATRDIIENHIFMHRTQLFTSSVSHFPGNPVIFTGHTPFITKSGELEFSDAPTTSAGIWGLPIPEDTVPWTHMASVVLAPNTRAQIHIFRKEATYQVPFSYKQVDGFSSVQHLIQYLYDGVCTTVSQYDTGHDIQVFPRTAEDNLPLGVELVPGSGIFEYEISYEQEKVEADEADQGSNSQRDIIQDELEQEANAVAGINTDASDQVIQEV